MPKIYFKSKEAHTEAWMYMMRTCQGFWHSNEEGNWWMEPMATDCPEEDAETLERLKGIAE